MLQELRFAHRALLRSPGYVGAAVVTLALGIGVNIAVASFAWSVLLRPLPIAEPDRVVMIYPANSALERVRQPIAFVKFREWRARNSVFEDLAVSTPLTIQLADADGDEIAAAAVSDNFLRLLRVRPIDGRWLDARDRDGAEGAVPCVVSAPFARRVSGEARPIGRRRCQARTVSGLTMTSAVRQLLQSRASHTHRRRSAAVSRSRGDRAR